MDPDVSISTLDHPWRGSAASPRVSAAPAAALRAASIVPKLTALILSAGLHAALALGAMQWTFTFDTTRAQTRFRQGETQVMNVRLTLAPPSPTFTESTVKTTPETDPQPPAPQPPTAPHSPAPQQPAPPTPSDFAGNPDPARPDREQPGDAPGLSAIPKNTLATTEPVEQPDDLTPPRPDERSEEPVRPTVADPASPPPPVPADPPKTKPTETPPVKPSQPAVAASIAPTAKSDAPAQPTNPKTTAIARATPKPREASIIPPVSAPAAPPALPTSPSSVAKPRADEAVSPSPASAPGVTRGIDLVELIEPRYPPLSIRAKEEGTVLLEIEVLPDGTVGIIRVVQSSGFTRLNEAAIDAVRRSRFSPAMRDGKPVRDLLVKGFRFDYKRPGGG